MQAVPELLEQRRAGADLVRLAQRGTDLVAHSGEEGEAHAATDHDRVGDAEERTDDAELVGHLGPAGDGDERTLRRLTDPEQHLDLTGEESPCGGGQHRRRADDGGVRPVRRPERVVHVQVVTGHQTLHERRVVGGLPRVEAEVVEQLHTRCELGEARPHRLHRERRVRGTLRPAEVRARRHPRAPGGQPLDRRQRGPDAEVVGDDAVTDGHVEVGPEQDRPPLDVAEVLELRNSELHVGLSGWLRRRSWPGRPDGSSSPSRCRTS